MSGYDSVKQEEEDTIFYKVSAKVGVWEGGPGLRTWVGEESWRCFAGKCRGFLRNNYVAFTIVKLFPGVGGTAREFSLNTDAVLGAGSGTEQHQQLASM